MDRDAAFNAFVEAWTAGRRPDVDAALDAVAPDERDALGDAIADWIAFAPAPVYDPDALAAIAAEPALAGALEALAAPAGPLPGMLARLRLRAGLEPPELAARLARRAGVSGQEAKTEAYVRRLEGGELDTARLSRRLLDALGRVLGADPADLRGAAALGVPASGLAFRATADAVPAEVVQRIELLAAAASMPAPSSWDEVDALFLGGG